MSQEQSFQKGKENRCKIAWTLCKWGIYYNLLIASTNSEHEHGNMLTEIYIKMAL